mmetsp:Transcript_28837/g.60701  ORF Transcript_28837/g.60701 Transcript_28837/m.60701 type:complete len:783 (+) Transcript_28837:2-2350(+)
MQQQQQQHMNLQGQQGQIQHMNQQGQGNQYLMDGEQQFNQVQSDNPQGQNSCNDFGNSINTNNRNACGTHQNLQQNQDSNNNNQAQPQQMHIQDLNNLIQSKNNSSAGNAGGGDNGISGNLTSNEVNDDGNSDDFEPSDYRRDGDDSSPGGLDFLLNMPFMDENDRDGGNAAEGEQSQQQQPQNQLQQEQQGLQMNQQVFQIQHQVNQPSQEMMQNQQMQRSPSAMSQQSQHQAMNHQIPMRSPSAMSHLSQNGIMRPPSVISQYPLQQQQRQQSIGQQGPMRPPSAMSQHSHLPGHLGPMRPPSAMSQHSHLPGHQVPMRPPSAMSQHSHHTSVSMDPTSTMINVAEERSKLQEINNTQKIQESLRNMRQRQQAQFQSRQQQVLQQQQQQHDHLNQLKLHHQQQLQMQQQQCNTSNPNHHSGNHQGQNLANVQPQSITSSFPVENHLSQISSQTSKKGIIDVDEMVPISQANTRNRSLNKRRPRSNSHNSTSLDPCSTGYQYVQVVGGNKRAHTDSSADSSAGEKSGLNLKSSLHDYLDSILTSRGYVTGKRPAKQLGYAKSPSPLQYASFGFAVCSTIKKGGADRLKCLLEAGLSPNPTNKFGDSPFFMACKRGFHEQVKVFVDLGAEVKIADGFGRTPLHYVAWSPTPCFESAQILLEADARLLYVTDHFGKTPLDFVGDSDRSKWVNFLESVKEKLWPVNSGGPYFPEDRGEGSTLADPPGALPIDLAEQVAGGLLMPEDAKKKHQQQQQLQEKEQQEKEQQHAKEQQDQDQKTNESS